MEYSQVMLEMLERIKVLENKVADLEKRLSGADGAKQGNALPNSVPAAKHGNERLNKASLKYRGLTEYLLASGSSTVTLTYQQLEEILGFRLPETARKYSQPFWSNTETHSYSSSWLAVGYRARVGADGRSVTFVKNLV